MADLTDAELAASIFGEQADDSQHPESEAIEKPATEEETGAEGEEKPADTEEPEETGNEPEPEQPAEERLFAGKYKTVEDMEKAYLESQKDFHAGRQEQGALRRELEELKTLLITKPQKQPKQPTPQEQAQEAEILRQRLTYEPEKVIEEMAEQRARNIVDAKLNEVLGPVLPSIQRQARADQINQQVQQYWSDHPDHEPYREAMAEIITYNPQLMKDSNWIGQTYLMAKIADLETKLNAGPVKPTKKVDPAQKKAAAVSASAGAKAAVTEKKSDEDTLKDALFGPSNEKRGVFDH